MDKYHFSKIDKEKIDSLIKAIPEIKTKYEIYSKGAETSAEYNSKAKEFSKKNFKSNKQFKEKRWNAKLNFKKSRTELYELTKKWNNEMRILFKKYNYIKLSDFYELNRYSWSSKPTKEFNYTVNLVAKAINIPLLFEINIGYGKVKLTNLYPKLWLELNGKELFEQSENILPITDFDKYEK